MYLLSVCIWRIKYYYYYKQCKWQSQAWALRWHVSVSYALLWICFIVINIKQQSNAVELNSLRLARGEGCWCCCVWCDGEAWAEPEPDRMDLSCASNAWNIKIFIRRRRRFYFPQYNVQTNTNAYVAYTMWKAARKALAIQAGRL